MSVLVYAELINGQFKKTAFEVVSYASKLSGGTCVALTNADPEKAKELAAYGASKIISFSSDAIFDSAVLAQIIAKAAEQNGSDTVVLTDDSRSKAVLGRLAVKLDAAVVSGVNALPDGDGNFRKSVFSAKAQAHYSLKASRKVISVARNSIAPEENPVDPSVETLDVSGLDSRLELVELKRVQGKVPLPEAELVVSAGRGMKGPENWGIIEELAETLGATTACSRPVSDSGWRPHHEHVGQTGIAIKPNLYIAIGISGAIQHLAGVNNSKTIVVINKDPEAPFFKAADYGVVADLFDVVPRLNEAIKKYKSS